MFTKLLPNFYYCAVFEYCELVLLRGTWTMLDSISNILQ